MMIRYLIVVLCYVVGSFAYAGEAVAPTLTPSDWANAGRAAAAIRTLRQQLQAQPQNLTLAVQLAQLQHREGRTSDAIATLHAALKTRIDDQDRAARRLLAQLEPTPANWQAVCTRDATPDDYESLGRSLVKARQFAAAEHAFTLATKTTDPLQHTRIHWHRSQLHLANNDAEKALAALKQYLASQPTDVAAYRQLATILRKLGRESEIDPQLAAIRTANPKLLAAEWVRLAERPSTAFSLLQEHAQSTADQAYFELLMEVLAKQNDSSRWLTLADTIFPPQATPNVPTKVATPTLTPFERQRRAAFAAASMKFPDILVRNAADPWTATRNHSEDAWELMSWAASRRGRSDIVEKTLREAMTAASGQADRGFRAMNRYRFHLYRQKKWQAIVDLMETHPGLGLSQRSYFSATPLANLGQDDIALRMIEKAKPEFRFEAFRERIHILELAGRYPQMLSECDATTEEFKLPSEVISIRYLRAQAYLGLKQFAKAEAELRGILEDDPDDTLALNNLGYNLAEQNRKLGEAERLIRRAILLDREQRTARSDAVTEHAAYIDSLGWVLYRQGRLTDARTELEHAAELLDGATDPTVWDHLGDVCFRQGDRNRAQSAWMQAQRLFAMSSTPKSQAYAAEAERKLRLVR